MIEITRDTLIRITITVFSPDGLPCVHPVLKAILPQGRFKHRHIALLNHETEDLEREKPMYQKTFYEQELERIAKQHLLTENLLIRVRKEKHFMQNSLSKKIDLEDIAASAAMSRFHFIRIFQQIYGVSPRLFLRDLRITRAKDLIKVGFTVTQTCHDVGYDSLTTFSGTFKRCTGVSPIAYRKLNVSNRGEVVR